MKANSPIIAPLMAVGLLASATLAFAQGPLTPPGPPAPTMKTLTQIEPRTPITNLPVTITQPGSYYLTGNLTCSACTNSQNGITVSTGNVSIDLNGFVLQGATGSANGIWAPIISLFTNCIVRNGTVSGWGGAGVSLINFEGGLVLECSSSGNVGDGIDTGYGFVVRDCSAALNGGAGISASGFNAVSGCAAFHNNGVGINGNVFSSVTGCTASQNGGAGIVASTSTINGCTTIANSAQGINGGQSSTVSGCTAYQNSLDGILVTAYSYVFNNTSTGNGGTPTFQGGIHATGDGNRIDSNHSFFNADGILVDTNATANIVIRNMSASNGGFNYRVPGIPTQPPAGANIVGRVVNDATNNTVNAWSNFQ